MVTLSSFVHVGVWHSIRSDETNDAGVDIIVAVLLKIHTTLFSCSDVPNTEKPLPRTATTEPPLIGPDTGCMDINFG